MARYIQKISLGMGKERWLGWDIDGVGTEIPGLVLADSFAPEELTAHGVRKFIPMSFDDFLRLGAATATRTGELPLDEDDVTFRMDALLVALERMRLSGNPDVPRALLASIFGDEHIDDRRLQRRLYEWQYQGLVLVVGRDDCYLKVLRRLT